MTGTLILNQDWKDYDNRKTRNNRDKSKFLCEDWEVRYLAIKIKSLYPEFSDVTVTSAIGECCRTIPAPRQRSDFVHCVLKRLSGE